jgi:hypothetical protein
MHLGITSLTINFLDFKTMRKLIIASLILIGILLSGCTNKAFKTVAITTNPTEKQKGLLAIACTAQFGKSEPQIIEGKTKTDTLNIYSTDTVLITKNDTVLITVTNTVKTIVNNNRTDTIRQGDKAREWLLESRMRDKDNQISNLNNDNKQKTDKIIDQRHKLVIAMIGYGIELLALILFVALKVRGKIGL